MTCRLRRTLAVAALCLWLLAACGGSEQAAAPATTDSPAWNHDPADADLGPASWGTIDESFEACQTGMAQSPVDIGDAVPSDLPPLEFSYTATPLVVENTGHAIEVPMPDGSAQMLTIGDEEYRLVQYHFHAPSEHTLGGASHAVEVHLVHQNDAGQLAVVGVFLEEGDTSMELLDSVLANAPELAGEEVELEEDGSPLSLVPVEGSSAEVADYYAYPGSLTTPGCTEGVRWIVLEDTLGVSTATADRLHQLISGFPGYNGHEDNNRPTQPLNDREIESSRE